MKSRKLAIYIDTEMWYKSKGVVSLPWYEPFGTEKLLKFIFNKRVVAFIKVSLDPIEKNVLWIDEFEVIRNYRKQGIGKKIIRNLIKNNEFDIKIFAKNSSVQKFWEKCGFKDDGVNTFEIPMVFKRKR